MMATDGSADHQAAQRRAIEGPSGSPHALTLEVDTDYYDALEGSDFDWQAVARARTGTRVRWADSVVSPKQRRRLSLAESWHDENVAGEELEEYSSWQISLGIANERAALTCPVRPRTSWPYIFRGHQLLFHNPYLLQRTLAPQQCLDSSVLCFAPLQGQPTIDEFAPWQQRLGLQAALEEQERAAGGGGDATPLPRRAGAKWQDCDATFASDGKAVVPVLWPPQVHSDSAATPNRLSPQSLPSHTSLPRSPRFSFRRRNSAPAMAGGKKKSILRDRSRHHPKPVASSASFASPRWRSQDTVKGHMRVITNKAELQPES